MSFDLQPTLACALLTLRPLRADDFEALYVIGSSRYFGYDEAKSEIEIGWTFLARSHWGGRYNAEMKRLMLEHAFRFVQRVVFLIGPPNLRSQKAIEKIGAVRAGSRVVDKGGVPFEVLVYQITRT
jgi:RimJ/RimL family protein N-acetyltransferase